MRLFNSQFVPLCIALLTAALLTAAPLTSQAVDTYFNRNTPSESQSRMKSFVAAGQKIVCVAFPPAGGNRWSIVTDKTFYNRNVPSACHSQMVAFLNAGHKIKCVAYPPAGGDRWSIVTDKSFANRNIPTECHNQMVAYHNAGHRVVWVAFPPAGGNSFSIVTDKGSYYNRNIPSECHSRMGTFASAGHKIRCVAFPTAGGNRWSIVTDKSFFNRSTPTNLHRVMRAMFRFPGGPLRGVAFTPNGKGFSILSDAHPNGIPSTINVGNEYFSLDKFANNLRSSLAGKGVKWSFAIRHGNATRSYSSGAKRTPWSPPAQSFSIYDRFNPASVSKTITGVAVLRALQNRGVSVDERIYKYLPSFWSKPSSVRTITFKELLNHRSGFRGTGFSQDYNGLRSMVAAGINLSNKVYDYENVNFALARIVCAYLDGYSETGVTNHGKATSDRFIRFVQTYVMNPCGAPSVLWKPDSVEPTIFYPDPAGSSPGTTYGDWSLKPGAAGLGISVAELNIFLERLRNSTSILGNAKKSEMDTYYLGWDGKTSVKHGYYHRKGGFFPGTGGWNGGAELRAYVAQFSNGIQVAAVMNGYTGIDIKDAYNKAWAPKIVTITSATRSIANITASSIVVSGQNMDAVNKAYFGRYTITSKIYTDPTKAYIRPLSSTKLLVHLPQGLSPTTYALRVATGLSTSNSVNVGVVTPQSPVLVMPSKPVAGTNFWAFASSANLSASTMWLALSPSNNASAIPGVVSLGIGDNFAALFIWPVSQSINPTTKSASFRLPSNASLKGTTFYFQGLYATALPLAVSNVAMVQLQ